MNYDANKDPVIQTLLSLHSDLAADSAKRKAAYQQASSDLMSGMQSKLQQRDASAGAAAGEAANIEAQRANNNMAQSQDAENGADSDMQKRMDKDAYLEAAEQNLAGDNQLNDQRTGSDREMGQEKEIFDKAAATQRAEDMDSRRNPYLDMPNGTLANREQGRSIGDFLSSVRNPPRESMQGYKGPEEQPMNSDSKSKMMSDLDKAKSSTEEGISSLPTVDVALQHNPEHVKALAELELAKRATLNQLAAAGGAQGGAPAPPGTAAGLEQASQQATQLQSMPPAQMPTPTQPNLPPTGAAPQPQYGIDDYYQFLRSQGYQ